jgi:hypothetical protein
LWHSSGAFRGALGRPIWAPRPFHVLNLRVVEGLRAPERAAEGRRRGREQPVPARTATPEPSRAARAGQRDVLSRALLWAVIEVGVPSERCSVKAASVAKEVVELVKLAGRGRALRRAGSRKRLAAFGPRTVELAGCGAGDRQPGLVQAAVASSDCAWPVAQEVVVLCHAFGGLQRRPAARFSAAHEESRQRSVCGQRRRGALLGGQLVRVGEQAGGRVRICDACVGACGAHGATCACVRAGAGGAQGRLGEADRARQVAPLCLSAR